MIFCLTNHGLLRDSGAASSTDSTQVGLILLGSWDFLTSTAWNGMGWGRSHHIDENQQRINKELVPLGSQWLGE